jgi:hypothetical protein
MGRAEAEGRRPSAAIGGRGVQAKLAAVLGIDNG